VSEEEKAARIAAYWLNKAKEPLESARTMERQSHYDFAINRAYYAAFYAAKAVLLLKGSHFVKHSGVRAAVHRDLVHPGLLKPSLGQSYDTLFDRRMMADYAELANLTREQATADIHAAEIFVAEMERLAAKPKGCCTGATSGCGSRPTVTGWSAA
jgi:uncharacterized protein (UPF0332 family)